jgi:FAD synthetase
MTRVVAQGTFDILHPGHVHYLEAAKALGDHLSVIVSRTPNVTHKPGPVISDQQRAEMVEALDPVDSVLLGHPDDIFVPIENLDPDIIVLGHDQHHDMDALEAELDRRGIDCDFHRASARTPQFDGELLSTRDIIDRILDERSQD